jgi:hypothetical protein
MPPVRRAPPVRPLSAGGAILISRPALRALAAIGIAALAALGGGCGGGESDSAAQAPQALPEGRKLVIFEPGPIYLTGPLRNQILDDVVALGVNTVRVTLFWGDVAPDAEPPGWEAADPADRNYDFAPYDDFMRAAKARGLKVLMTIGGPAPLWATRDGRNELSPEPVRFGEFATAVARRYRGGFDPDGEGGAGALPAVDTWSVWNEPNISIFLQPQLRDGAPYSPILYRHLYLAAQQAIAAADPGAPVLVGETAPTRGLDGVDPIPFARGVLCLDPIARADPVCEEGRIDAAGWATHPYGTSGTPPFEDPPGSGFVTFPSLANLVSVLDAAADIDQVEARLPVFITEYGVQSRPDPTIGVPLQAQADYLSISERLAYTDPRIASYAQYLMRDDPPDRVPGERFGGFESGLRFHDGAEKPSFDSFRLPLVVRRDGADVFIWGLARPAAGPTEVEVHVADGGRERLLRRLRTDEAGTFELRSEYRDGRVWQLRWQSPEGESYRGPWTGSYEFALPGADR